MAFSFDSHLGISAALLCAVSALAWILASGRGASVRLNLRFAAMLFASLGVAGILAALTPSFLGAVFAIALLIVGLASTALALSLFAPRPAPPLPASVALAASLIAGLVSALGDVPVFVLACQLAAVSAMLLFGAARFAQARLTSAEIIGGALALLGGGMALLEGALAGALILFAAGLLGLACASQMRVEDTGAAGFVPVIGRPRF